MRGYAQAFVFITQPIVIISLTFVINAQRIAFAARAIVFTALEIENKAQVIMSRSLCNERCVLEIMHLVFV